MKAQYDKIMATIINRLAYIEGNMTTKQGLRELESRIFSHIDRFIKLYDRHDTEIAALGHKYDRLEGRVGRLEERSDLGS
jgi:hypothetical protein